MNFRYQTGEEVAAGDVVDINHRCAVVEKLIAPGTADASDFGCEATGGVLLQFGDGDLQLWPQPDEDLRFVSRK